FAKSASSPTTSGWLPLDRRRRYRHATATIATIVLLATAAAYALHRSNSAATSATASQRTLPAEAACSSISVQSVWRRVFPRLSTGGPLRLLDVNQDGVPDVILTFGQDFDRLVPMGADCSDSTTPASACAGGIEALDGATGRTIWRSRLEQRPMAVSCEADLNKDGLPDCLVGGRGGLLSAHDAATGARLWRSLVTRGRKAYFTAQPIGDVDDDGVPDFVQTRGGGGDDLDELPPKGELLLLSGATGAETAWQYVPDRRPVHLPPQIVRLADNGRGSDDGSRRILFSTGGDFEDGDRQGGALYLLRLKTFLLSGEAAKTAPVISGVSHKGPLGGPATLADLNSDSRPELILPLLNGSVMAADVTHLFGSQRRVRSTVWRADLPGSVKGAEVRWALAPGFFSQDRVPDFFVQYCVGPGYPVYRSQRFVVLDGSTGRVIKELPPAEAAVGIAGSLGSPLTVSFEGVGQDLFLHWRLDCRRRRTSGAAKWLPCWRRFNANSAAQLLLVGQHIPASGVTVYDERAENDSSSDRPLATTGTLAPPVNRNSHGNDGSSSIDAVFAVASTADDPASQEQTCLDSYLSRSADRFNRASKSHGMSARRYRAMAMRRCSQKFNKIYSTHNINSDRFASKFKQLVVYRRRITCHCNRRARVSNRKCLRILPYSEQRWTAYMGNRADGYLRNAP
uniref:VCBS repeat-containing protein n=2 Tax=Macrostomum lignano TaxID=282301 RepID=A0A1I8HUA0_9PLAT